MPLAQRVAQNFDVCLRASWQQLVRLAESLHQVRESRCAGLRICRANLRKWKIGEDVGVAIERLVIHALQIGFGIKKKISEHHISKSLNRARELFVAIVFLRQAIQIRDHARIGAPALFLALRSRFCAIRGWARRFHRAC